MDYKLPERFENSNKSTYGKVLNIAGSDYMPGAAYLSSVSALKNRLWVLLFMFNRACD